MFAELMPLLTGRTVLFTVAKADDKLKSILLMGQFLNGRLQPSGLLRLCRPERTHR
jgi:hypothetical protein